MDIECRKNKILLILFLIVAVSALCSPACAWYQTYCYRQLHNITGSSTWGGSLTNYEVMFVVNTGSGSSSGNTIYLDNKAQSDLDDIRFTDTSDNLLDYWIESTSNPYNVWVRMPTLTTGTNQIYVYYGNASAAAYSNGYNVFNFFDHFTGASLNATAWTQSGGTVGVGSSILSVTGTASATEGIYSTSSFGMNCSYRALSKVVSHASGNSGLAFADSLSAPPVDYFNGFYQYFSSPNWYNGHYTKNGAATENTASLASGQDNYDIYEEFRNAATSSIYARNGATETNTGGINTQSIPVMVDTYYSGSKIYVDWIFVRDYRATEPAHSDWYTIETRPAPVADFTSNKTVVYPMDYIQFTDATTNTPTAWDWYFPNGVDSHIQNPIYTFDLLIGNTITSYNVSLNASHCGGYDWENKTGYITAYPLNASFAANITSGCGPLGVELNADITDNGTPTEWEWYIDDVWSGLGNVTTIYFGEEAQRGQVCYNVSLNASNLYSYGWENKTAFICVDGINASFTVNITQNCTPISVAFTDASDICTPTNWSWNFGNGNTSTLQNPVFTYETCGVYDVTLRAYSNASANWSYCNSWDELTIPGLIKSTNCYPVIPTPTSPPPVAPGVVVRGSSSLVYMMEVGFIAALVIVSIVGIFFIVLSRRRYDEY